MPYTTNQLITGSYYAAGVVSREFETVSASQLADGLGWLNDIISEKRVDDGMIPYETTYTFNSQIGVKVYFIPNLIQIDTLVFYLDQVRYAMVYTKRNQFFGAPRVENIQSLPFEWYWETKVGGGNLHIYFSPDKSYPMEIHGIFGLTNVSANQDLSSNITTADLGLSTIYGLGALIQNQLVVNGFDLMGSYSNIGALTNYINTGIIPGVTASIVQNEFVLSSNTEPPVPIYVQTAGYPPSGTQSKGVAASVSIVNLSNIYSNGIQGVGATLTAPTPAILTVSAYTPITGDRILVNGQTSAYQNGVYVLTSVNDGSVPWVLTRAVNYNQPVNVQNGDLIFIQQGAFQGSTYIQNNEVSIIGLSSISFLPFDAISFSNFSTIGLPLYEVFNALGFDEFYITYMRYALADRICAEYNYNTPVNVMRQLAKYEAWIQKKSRLIDLEMKKVSTLQRKGTYNWAFVNLGKGWSKPG